MNARRSRNQGRGYRAEGLVQVLILLTIGSMAAAASFTHVHNVAVAHGQAGWLAWADAVVLELMSIATGLEIRRRHRAGQPAGFVLGVLVAAVCLSLSAQVVEAERSIVGWLAAALPALGFLALVKIVLSRTPVAESSSSTADDIPPLVEPPSDSAPAQVPAPTPERMSPTGDSRPNVIPRPAADGRRRVIGETLPGLSPISMEAFTRVNGAAPATATESGVSS